MKYGMKYGVRYGKTYNVKWIDIDNVYSHDDDLRYRGRNIGGATFSRGEGIFCYEDIIFI